MGPPGATPILAHVTSDAHAPDRSRLTRFAWLSVAAALLTIGLKSGAYLLTGSVGLLSDAAESVVNLVAAVVALYVLRVAARPADDHHQFGHAKAEYFSAAVEGGMIVLAAAFIIYTAVQRLLDPQGLENVGIGLGVSVFASAINGVVAVVLMRAGRRYRSLTLTADGKHLLTDVWTSAGVVLGVLLVAVTGWERLDPIVAILVGINIIVTGYRLLMASTLGLMDSAWPEGEKADFAAMLGRFAGETVRFHALRTREAGHQKFAEVHMLVPGEWSVRRGHDVVEDVEEESRRLFPDVQLTVHLEPLEDPRAYDDFPTEVTIHQPVAATIDEGVTAAGDAESGPSRQDRRRG